MSLEGLTPCEERFAKAISRIDAENGNDPTKLCDHGEGQGRELVYSRWVTEWVLRLDPQAGEALLLAARGQHIRRWEVPRSSQPPGRAGYLRWRSEMKKFHAALMEEILTACGYEAAIVSRVRGLNLKENLASDPECQVLEDALCLVTLQYQLEDLREKMGEDKTISVLQKTWRKMSPKARAEAQSLTFSPPLASLVARALSAGVEPPAI